jgi:hypothetical protein
MRNKATAHLPYRDLHPLKIQQKDWRHLDAMKKRMDAELFTLKQLNYTYADIARDFEKLIETLGRYTGTAMADERPPSILPGENHL